MRARNKPGSEREHRALDAIPRDLIRRIAKGGVGVCPPQAHFFPLSLRCEILDAWDAARAAGATAEAAAEVLGLSSTTTITRWRRRRLELMRLLEPLVAR